MVDLPFKLHIGSGDSLLGHSEADRCLQAQVASRDPEVKTFVSSNGQVISLKKLEPLKDSEETKWNLDESYGININALLDKIENEREDVQVRARKSRETGSKKVQKVSLWTEKWRPKRFLDLVGNERLNRRVLFWLRQWSPLVFNEELPEMPAKNGFKKSGNDDDDDGPALDPLKRPMKKILLIHGPPGIGKTSVAHVVAKQAGYSIMEINASDERAGERVKQKVHNALFNHTFHEEPVCLIADEIDGSVENGFIRVLLDILKSDTKATHDFINKKFNNHKSNHKNKKRKKDRLLVRPIIAICNNVYASALEKLRPHCEIIHFQKPSDNALIERLEYVCKKEGVHISKSLIQDLATLSQGDVRNSLNNLQFLGKNDDPNKEVEITDEKRKDIGVSWFKICNSLFRKDPHVDSKIQLSALLRDIETNVNYEKILEGCFTLYPQMKYSDRSVTKPAAISDWLFFNDRMFQSLFEHNGELLRYCPFTPLAFFVLFSDIANKEDLKVKTNSFEIKERANACMTLSDSVKSKTPVTSQVYTNKKSLLMEVLPFVDEILSTDIAKVRNPQLRQQMLDMVLPLFEDFGLQIHQSSNMEYRNILRLEPPIDQIVLMEEKKMKDVITKRPGTLKYSLAKLEENRIRKRALDKLIKDKELNESRKKSRQDANASRPLDFFKNQYNSMKNPAEETNLSEVRPRNPFSFQREATPSLQTETGPANSDELRIWIKYKEGFSNAVRKNISWSQLWD